MLLLGIDIGTSFIKATVVDAAFREKCGISSCKACGNADYDSMIFIGLL